MYTSDWGPHLWYLLHITSYNLKKNDNVKYLRQMLIMLKQLIPCHKCRVHYCYNVQNTKIEQINSKSSAIEWIVDFHNTVNKHLGKKEISYLQANNNYNKTDIDNERILYIVNILNTYALFCNFNQYIDNFLKNLFKIYPDHSIINKLTSINFNYFQRMKNIFYNNGYMLQNVPLKYIVRYFPIIHESYNNVKIKYVSDNLKDKTKSIRLFETKVNSNIKYKFKIIPNKNILFKFKIKGHLNERSNDELNIKKPLLLIQNKYTTLYRFDLDYNKTIEVNIKTNSDNLIISFFPNSNKYIDIINNFMELKN